MPPELIRHLAPAFPVVTVVAALGADSVARALRRRPSIRLLARPAAQIGLGEVVRVLERDQPLVECFRVDGGACVITPQCRLKSFLFAAEAAFLDRLDHFTLADCALDPRGRPVKEALS